MRPALLALLAACGGPTSDDVFGADTTLEYVTRIGSPDQETCLDGSLASAQLSWTGTLCGESVNVTRSPY
ncbi:MAG TPA: hypothetical protein VGL61_09375 [Kofleriaceae bacterium]|jgi:hypothetical protein